MITHHRLGNNGRYSNQLFQIASAIGIALDNGHDYIFPNWEYSKFFKNPIPQGNIGDYTVIGERSFSYSDYIIGNGNYSLDGYFQTEKYFIHCSELIREYFKLKDEYKVHRDWFDSDTCSLHVRRGDYLYNNGHPVQPKEYYFNAMEIVKSDRYIIFSDDLEWCREVFKGEKYIFESNDSIIDQYLMSRCKNNIISNSTFSWWGAWLNVYIDKKVIAPKLWFAGVNSGLDTKDIYCEKWEII